MLLPPIPASLQRSVHEDEQAALIAALEPRRVEVREGAVASDSASHLDAGQLLAEHFQCRQTDIAPFEVKGQLSRESGYFRFGSNIVCYGQCSSGTPWKSITRSLHDARDHVATRPSTVCLPFVPAQVVDNLRFERYIADPAGGRPLPSNRIFRNLYYWIRPLMPVRVRKHLQKLYFTGRSRILFPEWPVDRTVESLFEQLLVLSMKSRKLDRLPFIWFWPEAARSCTILTHDVETSAGMKFCPQLMDLNDSFGIKSSFQIVPESRHPIPGSLLPSIRKRGFELNVHDLNHDGHLFSNRKQFLERAARINLYAQKYGAQGFRSAVMYRNIDWYDALDMSYDMSIPNVAHMDPQQGGCCTVLPFFIGKILELPVTTTQDYTLFHILNDYSIRLWKQQIDLILQKNGLISFIIHPDYIIDELARKVYSELLSYLTELRSQGATWIALPGEVNAWWRERSKMRLVKRENSWCIEGKGSERARLAYAVLENDALSYELASPSPVSPAQ